MGIIIIFAIMVMGLSGMVAQVLLLREMLVSFSGNELSIGLILANWLILEAVGSFSVGKTIERARRKVEAFVALQLLSSLYLPLAVYLIRIIRQILGLTPGEGVGLIGILYSSFLILLPVSLPHGALFTFGCKIYSLIKSGGEERAVPIGRVYVYETVGTILGAVGFTYLLVPYFHSFQIAIGVGVLNFITAILLLRAFQASGVGVSGRILAGLSAALLILGCFSLLGPIADELHWASIRGQWRGQKVVHYQNSIYGNITVIQRGEQYTFASDGVPVVTTPVPEITFVEEFAHLPLLTHPSPKRILLISGGAGGVINEILKHPVERVDYVELDPLVLKVIQRFSTPLTRRELNDPRVRIAHVDGRLFVKRTESKYDVVMIGPLEPSTLQINRLFTRQFFRLVKRILNRNGILVLTIPGSLTYLSEELRNLNSCIYNTLRDVYPHVSVVPGDLNLFMASPEPVRVEASLLSRRLKGRELRTNLITPPYLQYRLHPRWVRWFFDSLKSDSEIKINRDFHPLGLFYSLSYWSALFTPYLRGMFRWIEGLNLWAVLFPVGILALVFFLLSRKRRFVLTSLPFAIATTGFAGMAFDLLLIFTFQSLYGYVYHRIGLLTAAFMVGVAAGSLIITHFLPRLKEGKPWLIKIELAIILFAGMLPVVFLLFHPYLAKPVVFALLEVVFLVLSFLSGALIGAEFPLANKIYLKGSPHLSRTAGLLYGSDLFGGWVGGIVAGVVLLPILGLVRTCLVVVVLKVVSLGLIIISSYEKTL